MLRPSNPLVRGFDDRFFVQHSRHTGLNLKDLAAVPALRVLASGRRTGPNLLSTENGRQIFVTGHPEYDLFTLDAEYRRDLEKGLAISVPENYYPSDDPAQRPINRWRSHAHLLYHNWPCRPAALSLSLQNFPSLTPTMTSQGYRQEVVGNPNRRHYFSRRLSKNLAKFG